MILQEFKRCWKTKINIAILITMLYLVTPAYFSNLYEREERLYNVERGTALGYDMSDTLMQLEGSSGGLYQFESLLFLYSDVLFFTFVVFVIGAGINVAGGLFIALKTGYGTNIVTRISYKSYLRRVIVAQFLYILTFLLTFFLVFLTGMFILEGGAVEVSGLSRVSEDGNMSTSIYLLILLVVVLYIIICKALLILTASVSYVFLKNKYIIQFMPIGLYVGAYILFFIFGNLSNALNFLATVLIFEQSFFSFRALFSWQVDGVSFAFAVLHPVFFFVIALVLYNLNISKFGKNYLL